MLDQLQLQNRGVHQLCTPLMIAQPKHHRPQRSRRQVFGLIGCCIVIGALLSAIATFLVLIGVIPVIPTFSKGLTLVGLNVFFVLCLLIIIGYEVICLYHAKRRNPTGAKLHTSFVVLFSLISIVPTLLLSFVAPFAINKSLSLAYPEGVKHVVNGSVDIMGLYRDDLCQSLIRETHILTNSLNALPSSIVNDRAALNTYITQQAKNLDLHVVEIRQDLNTTYLINDLHIFEQRPLPTIKALEHAIAYDVPVCLLPNNGNIYAAIEKNVLFPKGFIIAQRMVAQPNAEFSDSAIQAKLEYTAFVKHEHMLKVAMAMVFILIACITLLSAVWIGLHAANYFAKPIIELVIAADLVAAGNFSIQVPIHNSVADLMHLSERFNKMINELRTQHNGLMNANALLNQRRMFIEAVLSGVSVGVIGIDSNGIITIVNPSIEKILEMPAASLNGQPLCSVLPELKHFFPIPIEALHTMLPHGHVKVTRNGREHVLSIRVIRDDTPLESSGSVITVDDITELASAQRRAAWADIARRIAHEIKNPLTPIQLSAERIQRNISRYNLENDTMLQECTSIIVSQVEQMKRMVNAFSSFARMPKPLIERHDLVTSIKNTLTTVRVTYPHIVFSLKTEHVELPALAPFDPHLLSQALLNLLNNAAQSIEQTDRAATKLGRVEVCLRMTADTYTIELLDNGIGFPKKNRLQLLEPYYTTRHNGTGLGLAIVSKIIEQHGGHLSLEDHPDGQGGCVKLFLPRRQSTLFHHTLE